ncbi:hypothetical protein AVEN_119807-1 [Araneus ventricosus]|uniref:Uncharacterized protein n=1 Tax=Araneus ventricosus TaxID=182803 RepID=A0A4Y2RLK7_ARAVE|nr:hypothetical protein AVEN_103373-1 [Araneus ventricosus]GBN76553.1 hypothetical protein AVEN_64395-1 [Araneus ventricosus]GBN76809.1 hypothetical protein AVEN_75207-1 [Araneus ventricosus]GBN76811.1 hypothetical protein AVEN_119807-1 [Araneus ventricosus]
MKVCLQNDLWNGLVRPVPLFSSLRVVGDMNGRPLISHLFLTAPLMTTCPTAFSPLSEQQPAEIRPTSAGVSWPVTAGLGVRGLNQDIFVIIFLTIVEENNRNILFEHLRH